MRSLARPTALTSVAAALTLASVTATAGYLLGKYEVFRFALPVHFQDGEPDRFVEKSYMVVLTPFWTQLLLTVIFCGVCMLLLSRAGSDTTDQDAVADHHRMLHGAEAIALLGLVWISFQLISAYSLAELWLNYGGGMGLVYNAGLVTAIVLSIVIGARTVMTVGGLASRHVEDVSLWRMKALYFNPSDPALFVPARYGHGLTLNFGRPIAIAIMLAILLAGLGGPFLLARSLLH